MFAFDKLLPRFAGTVHIEYTHNFVFLWRCILQLFVHFWAF